MTETWLSYEAADFLLFSAEVYWRLFERANAALGPLPAVAPLALAAALVWQRRAPATGMRALLGLLALGWAVGGWWFVWVLYAPVNWAALWVAPAFGLQAMLLALAAAGPLRAKAPPRRVGGTAALLLAAAIAYPLLAPLAGRPLAAGEVVLIAPDPTAVATLGAGLLLSPGARRALVLVIPALWLAASALTLLVLDGWAAAAPFTALTLALVALAPRRRR